MIIARPMGGLGNQLFQYANAYALSKSLNMPLGIDDRFYKNYQLHGGYRLSKLSLSASVLSDVELKCFPEWQARIATRIPLFGQIMTRWVHEANFTTKEKMRNANHLLIGYWQRSDLFQPYLKDLKKEFIPVTVDPEIKKLASQMHCSNSVSIHVRRGDYINNPTALKVHGVCSTDYYIQAINKIKACISQPVFYVFSDDIEWCKSHLDLDSTFIYIENNSPESDLWLMSHCKHHIIANSTFSWWGAWLGQHSQQVVISPEPWFEIPQRHTIDPSLPHWVRLKK